MKTKFRFLFSIIFGVALVCLAFSFVNINVDEIASAAVQKGGAIYLASGASFTMRGGTLSGHSGVNGGAVYVGKDATFTMKGGTITNCSATNGGAIYVASGGYCYIEGGTITGNTAVNEPAIYVEDGGVLEISENALITKNYYQKGQTTMNFYVDGAFSKTLTTTLNTYTPNESDLPLAYENCCGYFLDQDYIETFGDTNVDMRLYPSTINLYTKTASDPSNFTFTYNETTETYDIKASSTSISGHMVLPKQYNNVQTSITVRTDSSSGAFYNCKTITGITFQAGLTSVSEYAFHGCSGLTGSLIIPNSVTSIGIHAFYGCSGLTGSLIIPNSVKTLGDFAFDGCSSLSGKLIIGSGVSSLGVAAFKSCSGITSVSIDSGNSFYEIRKNAIIKKSTNELVGGFNFTDITINQEVSGIYSYAFYGCSEMSGELIFSNNLEYINSYAFYGCKGITGHVIIPNSVKSIGESVYVGFVIKFDGSSTFSSCTNITSVYIPGSVEILKIYNFMGVSGPFNNCSSLTAIYCENEVDATGWDADWNVNNGGGIMTAKTYHTVYYGYSLEQYKAAVGLTFAPTNNDGVGEELAGDVQISNDTKSNFNFAGDYKLDAILNEEKEYVAILKKEEA